MDAKLRRRDQNLEDALQQRDDEWKSKLEKKRKIIEWRTQGKGEKFHFRPNENGQ